MHSSIYTNQGAIRKLARFLELPPGWDRLGGMLNPLGGKRWVPAVLLLCLLAVTDWNRAAQQPYRLGPPIYGDDFQTDLSQWVVEQMPGGTVALRNGKLEIDDARGATVWFRTPLAGPVMIEYEATVVKAGGPNDNCRDLNAFWMAQDPKRPDDLLAGSASRGGDFRNYDALRLYYVGYGANRNTTTRFRRYPGDGSRPIEPQHDLTDARFMLRANTPMKIQIVASGETVRWMRDGETVFDYRDPQPLTRGWFGFRTVSNHLVIDNFRVYRLGPAGARAAAPAAAADRIQGLTEMAKRQGWRLLQHVKRGDSYLSERTVLRDAQTGCLTWRMTCDPAVDANDYYDIPSWNADGSVMGFLTSRAGGGRKEYWLMDANGGRLRPMIVEGKPAGAGYWSTRYRDRMYQAVHDDSSTAVTAVNPFTGERRLVVKVNRVLGEMSPPHPSEEYFLFGSRGDDFNRKSKAYVVGLSGSVEEVGFERRWHRLRFTKASDRRLFFNFDEPRTQWTILPDGSGRTSIPYTGGHPDWLPDGSELFYFGPDDARSSNVWGVRYDGTGRRLIAPFGGHGGPTLDGDWFVADGGAIEVFRTDGSQTTHFLFHHNSSSYPHPSRWHPDHHTSHPHPNTSPDGTKVIFNSDFLGQYTDVYVAVNRFPDPPRELEARGGLSGTLAWLPPRRSREIRGYHVYKSSESGVRYQRLTTHPVSAAEWRGLAKAGAGYYVVTALEHSGLESRPSNEVFAGSGGWQGPARVFVEAETGVARLPMEEMIDQRTASNGLYVASREGLPGGLVALDAVAPKTAKYRLWARVRGKGRIEVATDAGAWGPVACAGEQWSWSRAEAAVPLKAGALSLKLRPVTGGESIDKLLLTDDEAFVPAGLLELDSQAPPAPSGVKVTALSPNTLRVSWSGSAAADLDHFNVYAGAKPNFECDRAALISSPSEAEFVDWGLPLNSSYWYRVTAVDRAGNESTPADAAQGATPRFEPVRIALKPDEAPLERVTWDFVVPREGEYAIWGRSTHAEDASAAFDLYLDDRPSIPWRVFGQWDKWLWSPAGNRFTGTPQTVAIKTGKHTLRVAGKTRTSRVAEIVITDDPSWWPVTGMSVDRRAAQRRR